MFDSSGINALLESCWCFGMMEPVIFVHLRKYPNCWLFDGICSWSDHW